MKTVIILQNVAVCLAFYPLLGINMSPKSLRGGRDPVPSPNLRLLRHAAPSLRKPTVKRQSREVSPFWYQIPHRNPFEGVEEFRQRPQKWSFKSELKNHIWPTPAKMNQLMSTNELDALLPASIRIKKQAELAVIEKMSKLKALEQMALYNRENNYHKTETAKEEFEQTLNSMMRLVAAAKLAQLHSRNALVKYSTCEKDLARDDMTIRQVKEQEDDMYENLLESEKELVNANLEIIPRIESEHDLRQFVDNMRAL